MYVSRKKRNTPLPFPDTEVSIPDTRKESLENGILKEPLLSENSSVSEPFEIERDMYLEPEDEPWRNNIDLELEENEDDIGEMNPTGDEKGDLSVPNDPQDLDDGEAEEEEDRLTYEEFLSENTEQGALRIQASAGGQSIPLANVRITVYRDLADGRHIFYTVTTDPDGVADGMLLPAPPLENSVEGNGKIPFSSYTVMAERDGLRTLTVENVPIFAGIKSIQPITLSPSEREV